MKKLITGLLMALLMTTGLVGFANTSAVAADCPYEGCVDTTTAATAKAQNGPNKAVITVKVSAGNATPKGKVRVVVKKKSGAKIFYDVTKAYTGGKISFTTGKLNPSKYVFAAVFFNGEAKGFNPSSDKGSFTIK